ncbi:hypothetical protein Q2T94_18605 [Paeniglutamicibacter sulfureus]|uniref:hypothetical protein n=1 Tax=Paeniglutamicibacter sulfureus TaxID=43666 RepID=UPI0026667556|nr:hypothetical protein [Paeniglutamicibacter sulfureus]MDO2936311.1 hypothetical protein [Paeniglutamicibacter sulfureus]
MSQKRCLSPGSLAETVACTATVLPPASGILGVRDSGSARLWRTTLHSGIRRRMKNDIGTAVEANLRLGVDGTPT